MQGQQYTSLIAQAEAILGPNFQQPIKNYDALTTPSSESELRRQLHHNFKRCSFKDVMSSVRDASFKDVKGKKIIWVCFNQIARDGLSETDRHQKIVDQVYDRLKRNGLIFPIQEG